jgi:hypothetical protein
MEDGENHIRETPQDRFVLSAFVGIQPIFTSEYIILALSLYIYIYNY